MDEAATEAVRFVAKVEAAIEDLKTKHPVDRSNAFAAAKRASMDLTRALSAMRAIKWE